jgi:hypothetical protein
MSDKNSSLWELSSVSRLSAGLGICLLAAALGNTLDEVWRPLWAEGGAFGVIAAIGLGMAEKAHTVRAEQLRDSVSMARAESGLARHTQDCATIDSINSAVDRLTEHAARTRHSQVFPPDRHERPGRGPILDGQPMTITSLLDTDGFDPSAAVTIPGTLRQISSRSITLEHAGEITSRTALLMFELAHGVQLSLVVDVKWTQKIDAGFTSGGTILCAGIPSTVAQA